MVFLNGTLQTTVNWVATVQALDGRCATLAYDARAQGRSDPGPPPLSMERHAADLLVLLDHLNIGRAHLVGLSHGAGVALAMVQRAAGRVDRLVLCSAGDRRSTRQTALVRSWREVLRRGGLEALAWAVLPAVFGDAFLETHAGLLDRIVAAVARRNRAASIAAHLTALLDYPSLETMAHAVGRPCTVINATSDPLVPADSARRLADRLGARFIAAPPGTGHSIPAESPAWLAATLADVLDLPPKR